MKHPFAVANTLALFLVLTLDQYHLEPSAMIGVSGLVGVTAGFVGLRDPVRIPFFNAMNFSSRTMWAVYLGILGTLVFAFCWLVVHTVFYDKTLDRFGQSLIAYLLGCVSVLARPHSPFTAKAIYE